MASRLLSTSTSRVVGLASRAPLVAVPDRTVLHLDGKDTVKMLNALVTTNASKLSTRVEGSPPAQYCAFLNPQGRLIAPAFIHLIAEDQAYVDVDARVANELSAHIKKFKLRSKVKLSNVGSDVAVFASWGSEGEPSKENGIVARVTDPRAPGMGTRGIVQLASSSALDTSAEASRDYTIHRTVLGVAETATEIVANHALPLEVNVDISQGVDFRKGCYVGQELTARTHHTGVVRKRVVPVVLYPGDHAESSIARGASLTSQYDARAAQAMHDYIGDCTLASDVRSVPVHTREPGDDAVSGKKSRSMRERSAGKLLSHVGNVGLALLRLDQVARWGKDLTMRISVESVNRSILLRPFIPAWWPESAKGPE